MAQVDEFTDVGDDDDDDIAHHIGPIPRPKAPPTAAQFVAYNAEMRRWWEEEQQRMGRRWQEEDELAAPLPAEGYAAATYWRVGNPTGEEEEVDEELAWHAVIGTAADAAYGAMALRLDVQQVLRQAKLPHVSWHTILSNHVCHSVNACKAFQRFREQHHEVHHCRLVLPNSYAPDDGIVVSAEAAAPTKHEASEYACMAVFVLLCADRGGGRSSVLFCPAHWNVPIEALLDDIRRIVDPHAKYQPLAVNQRLLAYQFDQGKTQLSYCLRIWRQITAGNKMIKQIRQANGEMALIPMSAATKKVVWLQGVQATPDPMSQLPDGSQYCPIEVTKKIPEFLRRWFQIMEWNRPYRRTVFAEATAKELLLEECRKEARKQKKERIRVATVKKGKPSKTLSGPDYFDGEWQGAAIIRGNELEWPNGMVVKVEISNLSITIPGAGPGEFHRGSLANNQIHWDDGDVWTRERVQDSAPQEDFWRG